MAHHLHQLTASIRDYINNPRLQHALMKDRGLWFQLCSSLDVIGDSDLAIQAFKRRKKRVSAGAQYLATYGALQALFLQQDALYNLCEALGIDVKRHDYPRLQEIREARHQSVGHPTKHETRGQISYHSIVRVSLDSQGFDLLSNRPHERGEFRHIPVREFIRDQEKQAADLLTSALAELEGRDSTHKKEFRMEKLKIGFEKLSHPLEKLTSACDGDDDPAFGRYGLESIQDALAKFREALVRRGLDIDTYDAVKYGYERLEYPLRQLKAHLDGDTMLDQQAAYIFASFVAERLTELKAIAAEIDEEYSS